MKILYIHQYFATLKGSTGTRSYEFARRLVQAGHSVTVLTSRGQLEAELPHPLPSRYTFDCEGIRVVVLPVPYRQHMPMLPRIISFLSFAARSTCRAVRLPKHDLVYATSTPLTVAIPALVLRWLRGTPFVFEVRDLWPAVLVGIGALKNGSLAASLRWFEGLVYRRSAAVVTLSPGVTERIVPRLPAGHPVETIPNCADNALFGPDLPSTIRRERGWQQKIVCVHAGAMGPINHLTAIVRLAQRSRRDPRFVFWLIGQGRERAHLEAEVARLALTNVVIDDPVAKKDMPAVLAAADICLMTIAPCPVLELNSANKFFDYLAAGRPILLNYGGWMRDLLEPAGAGLGCPLGDDDAFYANLMRLADDHALIAQMGRRARQLAERFDRDRLFHKLRNLLEDIAGPPSA